MTDSTRRLPDLLRVRGTRRPRWVRALCLVGALFFLVLGVIGWLIPVVTGLPFYAAALVLLAMSSERAGGWINRLERKIPERFRRALRRGLRTIPSQHIRRHVHLPEDQDA
jgi:hypothetical protein